MKGIKAVIRHPKKHNVFLSGGIGGSNKTEWKVGDVKECEGDPVLCEHGFHFFAHTDLCFGVDYYNNSDLNKNNSETVFLEVEILGDVVEDTFKKATNKLRVIRYIPKKEWQSTLDNKTNSGNSNSGYRNSGDRNSGNSNSGYRNSGDWNSGYSNSGDWNSGYSNSGDRNSGNRNSGNSNSGDRNWGDWNSGNSNSGDWNSGNGYRNYFCTETKYFLFDTEVTKETIEQIRYIDMSWFSVIDCTYHEAWAKCPENVIDKFRSIPEFQTNEAKLKFKEITGLDL